MAAYAPSGKAKLSNLSLADDTGCFETLRLLTTRNSRQSLLAKYVLHLIGQRLRQIGYHGPVADLDEDLGRHA